MTGSREALGSLMKQGRDLSLPDGFFSQQND